MFLRQKTRPELRGNRTGVENLYVSYFFILYLSVGLRVNLSRNKFNWEVIIASKCANGQHIV